jgi:branched-subunit amino acid transport protein
VKPIFLVLLLAFVTYLPRLLPFIPAAQGTGKTVPSPSGSRLSGRAAFIGRFVDRVLAFIPYAALGALIFPGVMGVGDKHSFATAAGAAAAIIVSLMEGGLVLAVLVSVGATFAALSLF